MHEKRSDDHLQLRRACIPWSIITLCFPVICRELANRQIFYRPLFRFLFALLPLQNRLVVI